MRRKYYNFDELPEATLRRAAKILDGESSTARAFKSPQTIVFSIKVRSGHEDDVKFMYETFGGYKNTQVDGDVVWHWYNCQTGRVPAIMRACMPYLVARRRIGELILEVYGDLIRGRAGMTQKRKSRRVEILDEIKTINASLRAKTSRE
jgi:hypothetical protein